jgi:hypothetical protein
VPPAPAPLRLTYRRLAYVVPLLFLAGALVSHDAFVGATLLLVAWIAYTEIHSNRRGDG